MSVRHATNPDEYKTFDTDRLRAEYMVEEVFRPGELTICYTHHDRMLLAGAMPLAEPVALEARDILGTDFFLERREVGIVNIGAAGRVEAAGQSYDIGAREGLYIGRDVRDVALHSASADDPAKFYIVSTPAHASLGTTPFSLEGAVADDLGSDEESNRRTLYKLIHAGGVQSCQLMLGLTTLHGASMWNTMPAHIHDRRTELYLYFDLPEDARVVHLMGPPDETRHLLVANEQAVVSPGWSIHSGFGTRPYTFIWAMGGETYDFNDALGVPPTQLR